MDNTLQLKIITALQDKLSGPLKNIQGATGESAKALKELRDRLKDLEKTQKNVQQFRELSTSTKQVEKSLNEAQAKAQQLGAALSKVENPTKQMRREFETAQSAVNKLKAAHESQSTQLQRLRSDLSNAGVSTKNLSADERKLRTDITQTNESLKSKQAALRVTSEQQERLAAAQKKYQASQDVAAKMAVTGTASYMTGRKVLSGLGSIIQPGIEYEKAMSRTMSLTGLAKEDPRLAELDNQARALGASTMFSSTDVAQGQGFLGMAGFTPEAIKAAIPGLLNIALADGIELPVAADIGSNILSGFNLDANEMGRVSDVLAMAFTKHNVNITKLGETMKYVAPIASNLGQDIETMAASAGQLGNSAIQSGMAGTALRSILNRLSAPPKMAADALKGLKIQTKDAKGNLRDFTDILEDVYKKTSKMGNAQRAEYLKQIAGEEAVSAFTTLVGKAGSGALQESINLIRNSQGEAERVAKTMADNITGDIDEVSSAWDDIGISIYNSIVDPLRTIVQHLAQVLEKVGNWIKANPELTATIVKVVAVMGTFLVSMGSLAIALAALIGPFAMIKYGMTIFGIKAAAGVGVIGTLAGAFKTASLAVLGLGKALLLSPITWIVAAIAGSAYLVWKNWDWLKTKASEIWTAITGFFTDGWNTIKNVSSSVGSVIAGVIGGTWGAIKWSASSAWAGVKGFFTDGWATISSSSSNAILSLTNIITRWNPVALFQSAFASVSVFFGSLVSNFTGFGANMMQGLINGIKGMAGQAYEAISNVGSGVVGWFKEKLGIRSPSRVFAAMGGFLSEGLAVGIRKTANLAIKATKALATGVITAGMVASPAQASEVIKAPSVKFDKRPAISAKRTTGRAKPAQAVGQVSQSQAVTENIVINIYAGAMDPHEIAKVVKQELDRRDASRRSAQRSAYVDYGA